MLLIKGNLYMSELRGRRSKPNAVHLKVICRYTKKSEWISLSDIDTFTFESGEVYYSDMRIEYEASNKNARLYKFMRGDELVHVSASLADLRMDIKRGIIGA